MKILTTFQNGRLTLFFKGELDHHGAKEAMQTVDRLLEERLPRDCVMDLSGLTFMDSSGIALILKIYKRIMALGGRAWVENPRPQPLRVIDASGIDRIIKISHAVKE